MRAEPTLFAPRAASDSTASAAHRRARFSSAAAVADPAARDGRYSPMAVALFAAAGGDTLFPLAACRWSSDPAARCQGGSRVERPFAPLPAKRRP
jgi:hypothetical protein